VLQDFIGGLLKIDMAETRALTAHMSMPLKDDVARALAELNAPTSDELDLVDDVLDDVWNAMQKRNTFAHNAFCMHPETGEVMSWREQARGSLSGKLSPISANEIERDAALIYYAGMKLQGIMMTRNIAPVGRVGPLREPLKRTKAARESRRHLNG
jgi:hypothetical protein